jgi:AcrR family transcriptional regulator
MTDTRERLLDAGIALLHEVGVQPGVAHIRLADVAHRAGYTPSAAYRCWNTQADFHRDLAAASLAWRDRSLIADTTRMVRAMISAQAPWQEVLRVGGNSNVHRTPAEAEFYTALALRAAAGHDPTVRSAAEHRVAEGLRAHSELFTILLEVYGREVRAPYTIDHISAIIGALSDGFALQDISGENHPHLDRDDVGDGSGRDWTLFACVLEIVSDRMTRRKGEA